ncbi:hypothetical protein [Sinorhizobium medicae]|uniref:hypothetical protein n=1 Tax=Sinorhizobium medicae TaxID=110321 RepID=UPI0013E344B0|nr:hypothetical protein [Sinorhizobium medicae]
MADEIGSEGIGKVGVAQALPSLSKWSCGVEVPLAAPPETTRKLSLVHADGILVLPDAVIDYQVYVRGPPLFVLGRQ